NELKDVRYLKAFWTSIIHQRNQLSVKEMFDDRSLHLVEFAGRSQIQGIENLYNLSPIKEQTKNASDGILDNSQPPLKRLKKDQPVLAEDELATPAEHPTLQHDRQENLIREKITGLENVDDGRTYKRHRSQTPNNE
ncbi:25616_t:CDS:2, partial [Dentiscutata erythropus]